MGLHVEEPTNKGIQGIYGEVWRQRKSDKQKVSGQ